MTESSDHPLHAPRATKLFTTSTAALGIQLVAQLLIGLWLSRQYTANPAVAHADAVALHAGGADRILQALHYWGSALLILHGVVHLLGATWLGCYRRPFGPLFLAGLVILLASLGFQMTGNVLPFDRHGVQTAGIEASIAARAPVVGRFSSRLLLGGDSFNDRTVVVWYALHRFALPALALAALGMIFIGFRQTRSRPAWAFATIPFGLALLLSVAVPSPLGSAASADDYGAFAAKVSWYVWPLHGAMRAADLASVGWIGAIALPGLVVLFIALLPFIGGRVSPVAVRTVVFGFAGLLLAAGLGFGGSFAPLVGTRDPVEATDSGQSGTKPGGPAAPVDKALAERGRAAFNGQACVSCHGKDGATGGGGPVLTNVWKRHGDADYYLRYVKNPVSVQADSTMPAFPNLPEADLKAIAEFLREPKP